ncbi:MAG: hypothetical protein WAU07_00450 [Microgenomates group bacterium]
MSLKTILWPSIMIAILVFAGMYFYTNFRAHTSDSVPLPEESSMEANLPPEVINEDGEVDQEAFEANQAIDSDTSLEALESELDSTVILEEDFSDL